MFTQILNYKIFNESKLNLIEYIQGFKKVNIISGNPEVLYNGMKDQELFNIFTKENSVIIPDGVGTVIASKIVKNPVKEKIAGIEVMQLIIENCERDNEGIYLIGAKEEVAKACVLSLKAKHPKLTISGYHNGYFDMENCENIISDIKDKKPYAIFVAMGSPRQDKFILKYMDELPCRIFMGVGGSFDVLSGNIQRAPEWMIKTGMEWLYRVSKEPWRIKRLSSIPKFLTAVFSHRAK